MYRSGWTLPLALVGLGYSLLRTSAQPIYTPYAFTNFAGQPGIVGAADGIGNAAGFNLPHGIATDNAGNLYVSDTFNQTIRKITPDGTVTTIAGSAGARGYVDGVGTGQPARFTSPIGLSIDSNGNLYVGDTGNQTIRKVTSSAIVTTVAGQVGIAGSANGTGSAASFNNPQGTAVDSAGNIFVADNVNRTIRKITPAGLVTTFAGSTGLQGTNDGLGSVARFYQPSGMAVDSVDNIYVADVGGDSIRKITPGGLVTTLAGTGRLSGTNDGIGSAARFFNPQGVAVDGAGNVYVSDFGNQTIRKITAAGVVTTLAGTAGQSGSADGTNSAALFSAPRGIVVDRGTNIYVADSANSTIRKLVLNGSDCVVTTLAGSAGQNGSLDGPGTAARFHFPNSLAMDVAGNLYAIDRSNHDIRKIAPDGLVTTFAGVPGQAGSADGVGATAQFQGPQELTTDTSGNIYVVEFFNNTVRKIAPVGANWVVTTVAGCAGCAPGTNDGIGVAARFNGPFGLTRDSSGNLYVADTSNFTIRKITPSGTDWAVTTFVGAPGKQGATDGAGTVARLNGPHSLAADAAGNLFLSDGSAIRKITSAGVVTTLAGCPPPGCTDALGSVDGPGNVARFGLVQGITVDAAGNLYVADGSNDTIRKLTPSGTDWMVTTLAGSPGQSGAVDGVGSDARFNQPGGVAVDSAGTVYVVDSAEHRISRGALAPATAVVRFDSTTLSLTNGVFLPRVITSTSGTLILEVSTNFQSWIPIQTNAAPAGTVPFTVPVGSAPYEFFRAYLVP